MNKIFQNKHYKILFLPSTFIYESFSRERESDFCGFCVERYLQSSYMHLYIIINTVLLQKFFTNINQELKNIILSLTRRQTYIKNINIRRENK